MSDDSTMWNLALMALGVVALGSGAFLLDEKANTTTVTAEIRGKFELPVALGSATDSVVRISPVPELRDDKLFARSSVTASTAGANLNLWKSLRTGCRYKFLIHDSNPRGSAHYEIRDARLVSCG